VPVDRIGGWFVGISPHSSNKDSSMCIKDGLRLAFGVLLALTVPGCERANRTAAPVAQKAAPSGSAAQIIRPASLAPLVKAHLEGLGHMERFEYADATEALRKVHELAPDWIPGAINLAIALLNDTGLKEEEKKKLGGGPVYANNFQEAIGLLEGVLRREPKNPYALYCRGIIRQYLGELAAAHEDFAAVTEIDPNDGYAWLNAGATVSDANMRNPEARRKRAKDQIVYFTKALERSPYLVTAMYRLQIAHRDAGDFAKQKELLAVWHTLNPEDNVAAPGEVSSTSYGSMGKYASLIDPFKDTARTADAGAPPRFESPKAISISLAAGHRWAKASDFTGNLSIAGRFRDRFGMAVATFDADADDKLDLYLAGAVVGPDGVRDALLLNRGDGRFEDATIDFGLPKDRVSLGVAAADFDADRHVDLYLTGVGDNRLFRSVGSKKYEDVSTAIPVMGPAAISMTARWLDLDQDGDLDLYVVNYCAADQADLAFTQTPPTGLANSAFRNDGKPPSTEGFTESNWAPIAVAPKDLPARGGLTINFTAWSDPKTKALLGAPSRHTAVAALDIDDDRDIDLALASEDAPLVVALNDRLGAFHSLQAWLPESKSGAPAEMTIAADQPSRAVADSASRVGLLAADIDKDGRPDLVELRHGSAPRLWLNRTSSGGASSVRFEHAPIGAQKWKAALAADLNLDGATDLVGLPTLRSDLAPAWARNAGRTSLAAQPLALGPIGGELEPLAGMALADVVGDALPDLVLVRQGQPPEISRNLGNGHHWLALDLGGRWKVKPGAMRTNPHGLGARVQIQGQGLHVPYEVTTTEASSAQSVGPIVLGLGTSRAIPLVRVRWPDGVMQCELNQAVDTRLALSELNRKTGSCPVLFTWNGERYVCVADFLGGGGLGYLVAPGETSFPDRDEAVAIDSEQLKPSDGMLRLSILEPMDETAYLDQIRLDVVDLPPGFQGTPDERFAPGGNRPSGKMVTWNHDVPFIRATDLAGRDISDRLRTKDRRTADQFQKISGWTGYTEEHGIILDFGDQLARFGPTERLVLVLDGWVEYPYSQTNYAAATAGVKLQPPVLERQRADGGWDVLEADPGYPAGLPRTTTFELTGRLAGPRCVLRLRTNMECYWDRALIVIASQKPQGRVSTLDVSRAVLGYKGYVREVSPDGRQPLLYDYNYVDPSPLAKLSGPLTRYGDVRSLLHQDDDHLCLVGPGDELRLEFETRPLSTLPEGWTRRYVLRSVGYCKDADPATVSSDSVLPLPWRGMKTYPFGQDGERPMDPAYRAYLREFQIRNVER
jgi:tetratricopeptide (TPR) repeat protein